MAVRYSGNARPARPGAYTRIRPTRSFRKARHLSSDAASPVPNRAERHDPGAARAFLRLSTLRTSEKSAEAEDRPYTIVPWPLAVADTAVFQRAGVGALITS